MAEFDLAVLSGDLKPAHLVETDGQKALVTKIVQSLVQARFAVFGNGEYARISDERCIDAAASRSFVAKEQALCVVVFRADGEFKRWRGETVALEIRALVLHQALGIEGRDRRKQACDRRLIGGQRLGLGNLPVGAALRKENRRCVFLL